MKLKQLLSTALALVMTFSLSIPVFAADYETSVSYEGTGTEQYELTVPSQLKPGTAGNVTLSGTWASNRHITVTADETVAMTGSLGGSETLDVTFAGIDLAGNNETSVSETKQVSVEELNALFGNWTGTFYYNVDASNVGNTTVDTDSGSSSSGGGITNPDGSSSASDPLAGVDLSQAEGFAVTEKNRAAIGYTGEENENLVIPAYFVGDRENGTTEGRVYKVTSIEDLAFFRCYKLSRVTIPEGVTSIGEGAFYLCNLDSITISKNVANIGKEAFLGCTNLTSVTISEGVTSIGESAFEGCTNLTSITIPKSVTSIGKEAFLCCTNLTGVTISEGVTSIGEKTFDGCTNLTSITIPKSVTNIGFGVFVNCSKLTSIDVNAENNNYSSDNGVLFNKDKTELIRYPERKSGTTYTIPSSVTQITNNAFLGCYNLTNITIPEGVTSIEAYAFRSCGNLTSIIFNGTKEQWNAISKGTNWNGNTGSYTIYCTDGNIAK